ncbi:M28 family peptidase [Marivirga harenae]|uniref:M28 family peptidase n=1 Tax=Marivirga harenae TaxID=2010992 RepID=UPI0026DEC642|nr:M28 family peptidase [Marivirga harenae]WKV10713.1 M28 family peptidase [Marivirga harenae]|tara:strand:+ start:93487 stop:94971 length:1485 start_codon:yes stop_codon:yes gene_type:complete
MTKKIWIIGALLVSSFYVLAQEEADLVKNTIKKSTIKGHIYFLASDELAGRETGTPGIDVAARYISTTFQRYGVSPVKGATEGYFQEVPLVQKIAPDAYALQIGSESVLEEDLIRVEGSDVNINSDYVFLNYGTEEDFEKDNLEGKIAVVLAGQEDNQHYRFVYQASGKKSGLAKEAGAIGIVELHTENPDNWKTFQSFMGRGSSLGFASQETEESFFKLWVNDTNKKWLEKLDKRKKPELSITIGKSMQLPVPSKNVVGMVEGTDPELKDEFIIYSAHYDHLGIGKSNAEGDSIYNGARDNAVGVVTVMSAAESIAKNPTKRSALFILFTAEEKGLLGSRYYVENPLIPLDQMVYCFNSDNGGYNDTSLTTIIGLGRTTAGKHIKKASEAFGLKAIDDPAGEQGLFDRSDNVNFARKGIPAPTFSLGFTAFDAEIGKYYHQQSDNPESIDYDYMEQFFRAFVLSARLIANDEETPFWTEGDKYYEAGKSLYGK